MAKVTYSSLKVKSPTEIKEITFNDKTIEVKQYLPSAEKYNLIDITLQESKEDLEYNRIKTEVFFKVNILQEYTNIQLKIKDTEDMFKIYDETTKSGLLQAVIDAIPEIEYNKLLDSFEHELKNKENVELSVAGIVSNLLERLPKNTEAAANILQSFDMNKLKQLEVFKAISDGNVDLLNKLDKK